MSKILVALMVAVSLPAMADAQAQPAATPAARPGAAMSSATTPIGDLLDNAKAKAVVEKYLPEVVKSEQIEMARAMTLKDIQSYSPDVITDVKLKAIDTDLAALTK